jgi:FAD/FMN-containing dehydrogenase
MSPTLRLSSAVGAANLLPMSPVAEPIALSRSADILSELTALIGERHVLTGTDMASHLVEWRGLYKGSALCVVKPGSTAEVAAVVRAASRAGLAIVPQGGNTGLVGAQMPFDAERQIVLSLARMNRVREVDLLSDTMTVEAGVILMDAQDAADRVERLFPLSLASEGTCTIGGNLGSNAGGTAVLAYGNARDLVLGLEVVLADGRVWNGLGKLRKDNTGYDLKHLFIGSEGTLGVITAAVLKLFPKPKSVITAFCGLASPQAALDLLALAKSRAGTAVTTFELIPRLGIDMVTQAVPGNRDPLATRHDWYVLMELSSASDAGLEAVAETLLSEAMDWGLVADATLAVSLDQRLAFWRLRETLPEAQASEGGSIKHDISVPLSCIPALIEAVNRDLAAFLPGVRPLPFGHLGDGNLHYNITQPRGMDKAVYMALWDPISAIVHGHVVRVGGSISAEHGIGVLKRDLLGRVKDPVALEMMRAIKSALDPQGVLNPGKVLPPRGANS